MAGRESQTGEMDWASALRDQDRVAALGLAAADPVREVEAALNAAQPAGAAPVAVAALELHLIRGVSRVDLGGGPADTVIFHPEFLYLADVGRYAKAGVSVFWEAGQGLGDPSFPDFAKAKVRSVAGGAASNLIYPDVAGDLILGLDQGADPAAVKALLQAQGLTSVAISGTFGTARCELFQERAIAWRLTGTVPGLRYAEANPLVRRNDFAPGWSVRRIA